MRGYKVFNEDWTCNGFQYEIGKTYEYSGKIKLCKSGFHFCKKAENCFNYYAFNPENKVAEVFATGNIVESYDKCVTDNIEILRELPWAEVLEIVNIGRGNTGYRNSGDCNSGDFNSGKHNSGNCNSGNANSGHDNSGGQNSGHQNSGHYNSGWSNSGNRNSGNENSGHHNSGNANSGCFNSGNRNSGSYNSGNFNNGMFNSIETPVYVFNKPTDLTFSGIINHKGYTALLNTVLPLTEWVKYTEEEKSTDPQKALIGGYLKTRTYKEAWAFLWDYLREEDRTAVQTLPNFDPDIFFEITGIKIFE